MDMLNSLYAKLKEEQHEQADLSAGLQSWSITQEEI
jgi:hypothetical protein